jgi:hypothetical protein
MASHKTEGMMAELKTRKNERSVEAFLNLVEDQKKRQDCFTVLELLKQVTGAEPEMWGTSIVGFGTYHYKYESGREGDWLVTGFSPRKQDITLYLMTGFTPNGALLEKLGKHKMGKSRMHIKRLEEIDLQTLKEMITQAVNHPAASTP